MSTSSEKAPVFFGAWLEWKLHRRSYRPEKGSEATQAAVDDQQVV